MRFRFGKLNSAASMVAVALVGAGLAACHPHSTESLLEEAKKFQQQGDDNSAVIQLKNALQQDPNNLEARILLASIDLDDGDPVSAEKEARKAMSLGLAADRAINVLGRALLQQSQPQKVLDETKDMDAKNSVPVSVLQGEALLALGRVIEAKAAFDNALKLSPNDSNALTGMAHYAFQQHDLDGASRDLEAAITANPGDPYAWVSKGDLLRHEGEIEPSMAAYEHAMSIRPNLRTANISKIYLEISARKFDAAQADINAVRKSAPNNLLAFYLQALLDFNRGNYSAVPESLQKVLRSLPDHMPSVLLSAIIEYRNDALKQAEQHLNQYLGKNTDNVFARRLLAMTLLKAGRPKDAVDALSPVMAAGSSDPQFLSVAGYAYLQTHDYSKATDAFEKASALMPKNGSLHTYIGVSRLGQGESSQAVGEMARSVDLDSSSPAAGIVLALTEVRFKNFDAALKTAETLEKQFPKEPLVQNVKGAIYLSKHDMTAARTCFEKAVQLQPSYFPGVSNLAQLDLRDKQYDTARKRLETFVAQNKKSAEAMAMLADLANSQGRASEATSWLERASNENPDMVGPAMLLTNQYLRTGNAQGALTLIRKFQTLNPTNPELLDLLGRAQIANNDYAAALETFSKLVNVMPNSAAAQMRLADVHALMKNNAAVAEDLKNALERQPDFIEAEVAQAQLAVRLGDVDGALEYARQIQRRHAKLAIGFALEGDLLLMQKKPMPALHAYEQAFELGKSAALMIDIHNLLRQMGNAKDADARMAAWLKEHPNDIQAMLYLSGVNLADKQYKAAIDQLQAVLKQEPQNVLALNKLAWIYQQVKDPRAIATAEQALKLAGNSPTVMDTLGWILVDQGNIARGLPLLQKAEAMAPDAPDIHYHLASGLAKNGDKAAARKELTLALAGNKPFAQIEEARALQKQLN